MNFLSNFGVQGVLLAAQIVNFLILLFILKRFLYKPVLKVLADRKSKIALSLKQAEDIEIRLKKIEDEREAKISEAATEAQQIINDATSTAEKIIEDAHTKAQKDITSLVSQAEDSISQERAKMYQQIRQELANLVTEALRKVTPHVLTEKDQAEIRKTSLKEI